jgi:hypothetical protein
MGGNIYSFPVVPSEYLPGADRHCKRPRAMVRSHQQHCPSICICSVACSRVSSQGSSVLRQLLYHNQDRLGRLNMQCLTQSQLQALLTIQALPIRCPSGSLTSAIPHSQVLAQGSRQLPKCSCTAGRATSSCSHSCSCHSQQGQCRQAQQSSTAAWFTADSSMYYIQQYVLVSNGTCSLACMFSSSVPYFLFYMLLLPECCPSLHH